MDLVDATTRCVVTTIHGTWASAARWPRPDGSLGRALAARFGGSLVVEPFRWSGGNSPAARDTAQHELRAHLERLQRSYPGAAQVIVAHSHGGNIAFYALRDTALRERVAGVVCLATPFLVARERVLAGTGVRSHVIGAVGTIVIAIALLARWLLADVQPEWLRGLAVYATLLVGMVLLAALLKGWIAFAERLLRSLILPPLTRERVLIIRALGDEASAGLLLTQFISQMTVRMYVLLHGHHARVRERLTAWQDRRGRLVLALAVGLFLYAAAIVGAIAVDLPVALILALVLLLAWVAILAPIALLLHSVEMAAFPLQLVSGVVLVGAMLLLSAVLLPFGLEVAIGNLVLDVTAETTPPGEWTVHHLPDPGPTEWHRKGQPLQHSTLYEDPRAIALICNWIGERTAAVQETTR